MDIPQDVLDALAVVREASTVNMLDRDAVLRQVSDQHTLTSSHAFLWLVGDDGIGPRATLVQRTRYLAALTRLSA